MKLAFHGAAQGVTGSCLRLQVGGRQALVDCGLFQGSREIVDENREPFGFEPREIDWLLLTHAHLDHSGRIPLLVKAGFRGDIICTPATRELARLVLLDAAHLQEEDANHAERKARRRGGAAPGPLYTIDEAAWSFDRFGRDARYGEPMALAKGLDVTFIDAGHLGAASLVTDANEGGSARRIVVSGDVGSPGHPILRDPTPPPRADDLVLETTYGDRMHRSLAESVEELWQAIAATLERGGNAIVPTFALERSQEILYFLRQGMERGRVPRARRAGPRDEGDGRTPRRAGARGRAPCAEPGVRARLKRPPRCAPVCARRRDVPRRQCAISTGTVMLSRSVRVTPPRMISLTRACP